MHIQYVKNDFGFEGCCWYKLYGYGDHIVGWEGGVLFLVDRGMRVERKSGVFLIRMSTELFHDEFESVMAFD